MSAVSQGQELSLDAINMLLSSARGRGEYEDYLREYIASGKPGIEVNLTDGPLAGKDPKNVATGFKNVQGRNDKTTGKPVVEGAHLIKVLYRSVKQKDAEGNVVKDAQGNEVEEGHVFLINTAMLSDAQKAAVEAEASAAGQPQADETE